MEGGQRPDYPPSRLENARTIPLEKEFPKHRDGFTSERERVENRKFAVVQGTQPLSQVSKLAFQSVARLGCVIVANRSAHGDVPVRNT
jgi:hypothetical protein